MLQGNGGQLGFWADQNVPTEGTDSAAWGAAVSTACNIGFRLAADTDGTNAVVA
jgi:hypothetical protein